jgi:hypothetical protein
MRTTLVLAFAAGLAACGDDARAPAIDAGPADASPDARPPDTIQVAITTPTDGTVITGARTITVAGTLSAAAQVTQVIVTVGTVAFTPTFDQTSFTATVTLADRANPIHVVATDVIGGSGSATLTVTYPFVRLTTFGAASTVLGQPDLTTGTARATDATTVGDPVGDPALVGAALYLPALGEHRVLGYAAVPGTDGAAADFALGQTSLGAATPGSGAAQLDQPSTVASDGTHLFVADHGNNRVLGWLAVPAATGAAADFVLGQAGFATNSGACGPSALDGPLDVIAAGGHLIVADTNNDRVLIWSSIPTASGVAADLVIGQGDLAHCAANDDDQNGVADATPSRRTLDAPIGAWSDGKRLVVADSSNHRVLIWNTFPTTSFAPADAVLGQPDFTTAAPGLGPLALRTPQLLASNGNQLALCDTDNDRVLVWDALPTASGAVPDHVLGQSDLSHGAANDDDQDGTPDATPSGRTLSAPRGVLFTPTALIVSDAANERALVFP